jgi:hypothetical protein
LASSRFCSDSEIVVNAALVMQPLFNFTRGESGHWQRLSYSCWNACNYKWKWKSFFITFSTVKYCNLSYE